MIMKSDPRFSERCPKCGSYRVYSFGCQKCGKKVLWKCQRCGFTAKREYFRGKPLPSRRRRA